MDFLTNLEILLKNNDMKRADLARAIGVAYLRCTTLKCPNKSAKVEDVEKQIIEEIGKELQGFNYFLDNYANNLKSKRDAQLLELSLLDKELSKK